MSEKYEKTCKYLNYVEHLLILALTITSCVFKCFFFCFISLCSCWYYEFYSRICVCASTTRIKKYTSIIKKKRIMME